MSDAIPLCDRLAWSIPEFCQLCGISEPLYYKLQRNGQGPRRTKLGGRTVITREDGQEWLRERTDDATWHDEHNDREYDVASENSREDETA